VLVYDLWAGADGARELIEDVRELHPDKPVVLTSPGLLLNWVTTDGPHGVTPVLGPPTRRELVAAVETALHSELPPPAERRSAAQVNHGPRW
jgi:hypothetical protein